VARIVLGLATSHTPLFALDSGEWHQRAAVDLKNPRLCLSDGRWLSYADLLAERGPRHAAEADPATFAAKHAFCEAALDALAAALEAAQPDVVVIVGDDQGELFGSWNQPALAIYHGATVRTSNAFGRDGVPDWAQKAGRGYMMDAHHEIAVAAELGVGLVKGLIEAGVDVTSAAGMPPDPTRGLGHAYGFVVDRLLRRRAVPIVPVLLNTYYPPNVPGAARCHQVGVLLRRVIDALPGTQRIALVASGGMSHFVVDEALDRGVLDACVRHDAAALCALPRAALQSGSSEILNWVVVAGAMQDLNVQINRYLPLYRTPAGTGVGAGFLAWAP